MMALFVEGDCPSIEDSDTNEFSPNIGRVDILVGDKFRVQNRGGSTVLFLSNATFSSVLEKWSDYKSSDGSYCSCFFEGVYIHVLV